MAEDQKKTRSPNFSLNDSIFLAELMGRPSYLDSSLTNYGLLRHKFTSSITSATKRQLWTVVAEAFNAEAEVPRRSEDLTKKWDNLVQVHKSKFSDFRRQQQATGGGPRKLTLSVLTEAVMAVVGKTSATVIGLSSIEEGDTTWMQFDGNKSANCSVSEDAAPEFFLEDQNLTELMVQATSTVAKPVKRCLPVQATATATTSQCSRCQCSDCTNYRILKKQKLTLEIKYYEKKNEQ